MISALIHTIKSICQTQEFVRLKQLASINFWHVFVYPTSKWINQVLLKVIIGINSVFTEQCVHLATAL